MNLKGKQYDIQSIVLIHGHPHADGEKLCGHTLPCLGLAEHYARGMVFSGPPPVHRVWPHADSQSNNNRRRGEAFFDKD